MNKREKTLALIVVAIIGGIAVWTWVIDPAIAAFDAIDQESAQLEQDLSVARALVDNQSQIRKKWAGYELAGLSRSFEEAKAETGSALLVWAEQAGFEEVSRSRGDERLDDEMPFGEVIYTLQSAGDLRQLDDLLWQIRMAPFPLRLEKCVINSKNEKGDTLQFSLTVSTLFTPEASSE